MFGVFIKTKESEKRDTFLDLARELKKPMEHDGDGNRNCSCALGTISKKGLEDLKIRRQVETT